MKKIILVTLFLGALFRFFITADGNFYFNMDNARDMVDVREMVVLGHLRLIGQTTSIDGIYYGPGWYYLLTIPFILSGGHPYAPILMEITFWILGGFFLLYLAYKFYGTWAYVAVTCFWVASNFILLGSQYAFNPNPILFLTPIFIYCLWRFVESGKWWFATVSWFLAGAFLHFEVTVGLFMPLVIVLVIFLTKKSLFKTRSFYLAVLVFGLTLLPQLLFELRHNFFMTKALLSYQSTSHSMVSGSLIEKAADIFKGFYNTLLPTFMNFKLFTNIVIIIFTLVVLKLLRNTKKLDIVTLITLLLIFVPLLGLIPLKVGILPWYFNASLVASILAVGLVFYHLKTHFGKIVAVILVLVLVVFSVQNIHEYIKAAQRKSLGNSHLRTELSAIDYVYQQAGGKNFKVYTYLPSVYDWPYQYLFWWHGLKKYGYLPQEYAYAPNKPPYVPSKEKLEVGNQPESSGLVFLIKEPDQTGIRHLWENQFKNLELLKSENIGPLTIEVRNELPLF